MSLCLPPNTSFRGTLLLGKLTQLHSQRPSHKRGGSGRVVLAFGAGENQRAGIWHHNWIESRTAASFSQSLPRRGGRCWRVQSSRWRVYAEGIHISLFFLSSLNVLYKLQEWRNNSKVAKAIYYTTANIDSGMMKT